MKVDFRFITSEDFEFLCEEILRAKGFTIEARPARGPDGGKDLIAVRDFQDDVGLTHKEKWLIECKHFAVSGRSVTETAIGNFETRMQVHGANRYLLITSTVASETVKNQLRAVSEDQSSSRMTTFWTRYDLIRLLEENSAIAQRYSLDLEKQALNAVEMIRKHHGSAHRGAFLWCPEITAVFENRTHYKEAINVDELREALESQGVEELALCRSDDGETWLVLVRSPAARELDDLVWSLCTGDDLYIRVQKEEAFERIWRFHVEPVNDTC